MLLMLLMLLGYYPPLAGAAIAVANNKLIAVLCAAAGSGETFARIRINQAAVRSSGPFLASAEVAKPGVDSGTAGGTAAEDIEATAVCYQCGVYDVKQLFGRAM